MIDKATMLDGLGKYHKKIKPSLGGGASYDDFGGATSLSGGVHGLVPAPEAGDQNKFLCANGSWVSVSGGNADYTIGSKVSSVEGGFWQSTINDTPCLKLRHGDYEYNFNYDGVTYLGAASSPVATVTPDTYVLGSTSSTLDGGVWFELENDVPKILMHKGSFNYKFNYDSISYKGGNKNLVSFLPFDSSTTADACGKTWTASKTTVVLDTDTKKFGAASLYLPSGTYLQAENVVNASAAAWTFDCWVRLDTIQTAKTVVRISSDSDHIGWGVKIYPHKANTPNEDGSDYTAKTFPSSMSADTWYHLAVTRLNSDVRVFIDGELKVTLTAYDPFYCGTEFILGDHDCHFNNVRFFEGVALWTENFTVPTAEDYA